MFPGEIMPVPPLNAPVRLADPPAAIDVGAAAKLVIVGAVAVTVTVAVLVAVTPAEFVTVRV
jgi:hypothetical protein